MEVLDGKCLADWLPVRRVQPLPPQAAVLILNRRKVNHAPVRRPGKRRRFQVGEFGPFLFRRPAARGEGHQESAILPANAYGEGQPAAIRRESRAEHGMRRRQPALLSAGQIEQSEFLRRRNVNDVPSVCGPVRGRAAVLADRSRGATAGGGDHNRLSRRLPARERNGRSILQNHRIRLIEMARRERFLLAGGHVLIPDVIGAPAAGGIHQRASICRHRRSRAVEARGHGDVVSELHGWPVHKAPVGVDWQPPKVARPVTARKHQCLFARPGSDDPRVVFSAASGGQLPGRSRDLPGACGKRNAPQIAGSAAAPVSKHHLMLEPVMRHLKTLNSVQALPLKRLRNADANGLASARWNRPEVVLVRFFPARPDKNQISPVR